MPIEVSCDRTNIWIFPLIRLNHSHTAPQAQSKIKVLEKLPVLEPPEEDDSETFKYVSWLSHYVPGH